MNGLYTCSGRQFWDKILAITNWHDTDAFIIVMSRSHISYVPPWDMAGTTTSYQKGLLTRRKDVDDYTKTARGWTLATVTRLAKFKHLCILHMKDKDIVISNQYRIWRVERVATFSSG